MSDGAIGRLTLRLLSLRRLAAARYALTGIALLLLDMCVFFVLARVFLVSPAIAQLVARTAGVDNHCNTMFFPANSTVSPWPAFVGQMPVLRLEY